MLIYAGNERRSAQESPSLVKGAGMRSQSVTVRRFKSCLLHHYFLSLQFSTWVTIVMTIIVASAITAEEIQEQYEIFIGEQAET